MIRRYDLRRSDNFPFVGRKSYRCTGDGYLNISTGFPVTSAIITWSSVPIFNYNDEFSSSSLSSSSIDSSSSSSSSSSSKEYSSSSSSSSSFQAGNFTFYATDIDTNTIAINVVNCSIAGTFDFWVLDENQIDSLQVSVVGGVISGTFGFWAVDGDSNTIHITVIDGVVTLGEYSSSSSNSLDSSSSSSSSSMDSSSSKSSSSSSSLDSSSSSSSNSSFSSSSSSLDSSSSSSSEEYSSSSNSSSSSSNAWPGPFENPRIYISEYTSTGFIVKYENIPEEIGYFEFSYMAF
jgi:hypothetical protein